jgi:hypothetical protein
MRIAVISAWAQSRERLRGIARELSRELTARGHFVDTIEAMPGEQARLSGYDYLVALSETTGGFKGALPASLSEYLGQAGMISGKRGCALLLARGFGKQRGLRRLMACLEHEGVIVDYFEMIKGPGEAPVVAMGLLGARA